VGLDHLLVGRVDADMLLLDNGCICCAIRGELKDALWRLHQRRERGELPPFQRVLIETTGLAAPGPVIATLIGDAQLRQVFRPAFVATVVDALHADTHAQRPEWQAQVAAADRLYLSKTDLARPQDAEALRAQLARLNPLATLCDARQARPVWQGQPVQESHWLARAIAGTPRGRKGQEPHGGAQAFCLELDGPVDWCALTLWLTLLLHRHGERVLRLKGLVAVAAEGWPQGQPTVLHGMGHLMHAPEHLDQWPGGDRRSRLVFIASGLDGQQVCDSWQSFQRFFAQDNGARHSAATGPAAFH
jgi:G3E family GTPase